MQARRDLRLLERSHTKRTMAVTVGGGCKTAEQVPRSGKEVIRMVDWDSPDFGGHVTRAANGSWSTPDDEPEPDND